MAASMTCSAEVDALVGIYATIGRDARRGRSKRALAAAVGAVLVAGVGAAAWKYDFAPSLPRFRSAQAGELESLVARVEAGLVALGSVRVELEIERDRFSAKAAELDRTIATFNEQYAAIASQQQVLAAQSAQLENALAAIDRQRAELLAGRGAPAAEQRLAAIQQEREVLEERRIDFASQSAQLSLELEELERRRKALEAEKANAEKERAALEALLKSAGRGVPGRQETVPADPLAAPGGGAQEQVAQAADPYADAVTTASLIDSGTLGGMRAGFVSNGVNITLGLTRTASINGEETISNSLNFESLGAALQPGALSSMGLVVQNGGGNWLAPHLDGVPDSFFGTIVQNSLDNQHISTETVYDVTIQDVGSAVRGFSAMQALGDTLMFQR